MWRRPGVVVLVVALAGCPKKKPDEPVKESTASIRVDCANGNRFELTTGSDIGQCNTQTDANGNVTGGSCRDNAGNSAAATCEGNNGEGRCIETTGKGDCD